MNDREKNLNRNSSICPLLDDYLDGRTGPAECSAFEEHLSACANCRDQVESARILVNAFAPLSRLVMPDDSDLRIRIALGQNQRQPRSGSDVMDIDEAAAFLGVTVSELVNRLDELPAFEIAGRIRFNRERLIRWMETKERDLAWETSREKTSSKTNILTFPGGFSNEQLNRKANGSTV